MNNLSLVWYNGGTFLHAVDVLFKRYNLDIPSPRFYMNDEDCLDCFRCYLQLENIQRMLEGEMNDHKYLCQCMYALSQLKMVCATA